MKKIILSTLSVIAVTSIIFISCKSKNDGDAITPTYKQDAGTGGNPKTTDVTTTGTIVTTGNMQSSSMYSVGIGSTWQSSGCSGQTCLEVNSPTSQGGTGTTVTLCFLTAPTAGTYQLVSSMSLLAPGKACMTVFNPTGQDANTTWYSSGGTVNVTVNAPSITATFANVACYQPTNSFYSVTVSGQVGCL